MKALFVELPPFEKYREEYLGDDAFKELKQQLLMNPESGDVIQGTGGLRKIRFSDKKRGKGKRGGIRVIYYWYEKRVTLDSQFWLFTIYNKDEANDLTNEEKKALKKLLQRELKARQ